MTKTTGFDAPQTEVGEEAEDERSRAGWRYQPVFRDETLVGRLFSLVELYFDEDDKLEDWTDSPGMAPCGDSADELYEDICHMLADSMRWLPVPFDSLKAGMTFQRTGNDVEKVIKAMLAAMPRVQ